MIVNLYSELQRDNLMHLLVMACDLVLPKREIIYPLANSAHRLGKIRFAVKYVLRKSPST